MKQPPEVLWCERTEQKLRFARLHLDELVAMELPGHGHDFERSHIEAILSQLVGACDTFRRELLALAGRGSALIGRLEALREDETGWLGELVALRRASMHRSGVPMEFYMGGERHGQVALKHPDTLIVFPNRATDTLGTWLTNLRELFEELRGAARDGRS
jgi:hypothetical protein